MSNTPKKILTLSTSGYIIGNREGLIALQKSINAVISAPRATKSKFMVDSYNHDSDQADDVCQEEINIFMEEE